MIQQGVVVFVLGINAIVLGQNGKPDIGHVKNGRKTNKPMRRASKKQPYDLHRTF